MLKGNMKIDKKMFRKEIIKADFEMQFNHDENPSKSMFWKGKIFTKIE